MILLYRGTSPTSRLIRWFSWGPYSHAAWRRYDGQVYEAWHKSTSGSWWNRLRGETRLSTGAGELHTPGTEIDVYDVPALTAAERLEVDAWLDARLGRAYDWHGIIHFLGRRPESAADRTRWFCSEWVVAALQAVGRPPLARVNAYQVSPTLLSFSPLLAYVETLVVQDDHSEQPKAPATE